MPCYLAPRSEVRGSGAGGKHKKPWPVSIPAASPKAAPHAFTAEGRGSSLAPTGRRSFFVPQSAIDFGCDLPKLLKALSERERRVVLLRLQGATLEEIGAEIGVTRERIRQNELNALRKLRWRCARLGYKR